MLANFASTLPPLPAVSINTCPCFPRSIISSCWVWASSSSAVAGRTTKCNSCKLAAKIELGRGLQFHQQAFLPARHGEINLRQQLRIQQRAVQRRLELSTSYRSHSASRLFLFPGYSSFAIFSVSVTEWQHSLNGRQLRQPQFMVEEGDVERCVVHDQLGAFDELEQLVDNIDESLLVLKKFVCQSMDFQCALLDLPFGIEIIVECAVPSACGFAFPLPRFR